ncbi:MAG: TRAP transporter large permease subunit [Ruminococcaceae bacterium]|nr:TRAP transporter large permease subunit [Oscillospiraceae bacterium]
MVIRIVVPLALMLLVLFVKKLPYIGGKTWAALGLAGFSALLLGGLYSPLEWLKAWFSGLDRIAWIIGLAVFGSIYAQTQNEVGAIGTVLNLLRAKFGRSPKGLIVVILITLSIAGSLLGDTYAAATVVGVLTIGAMADLGLSGELITGIISIGAALGSIMPPITQSVFMSASMLGIDPSWATQPAYITVGTGIVVICFVVTKFFIKKDMRMPEELLMDKKASQIFREEWRNLIPLFVLIFCVICCAVPGGKLDFVTGSLNLINIGDNSLYNVLSGIPIVKMLTNKILLCIIIATVVAGCTKAMRGKALSCVIGGIKSIKSSLMTQLSLAFMLGSFYNGGVIDAIQQLTEGLNANALIIGGGLALLIIGMLTGTQSAPQSAIFSFLGPTLVGMGFHPVNVAIFGSHVASAGQAALPANLLVVVVASMVSSQIGKDVKPMKAMLYSCICGAWLAVTGFLMIYLPAWPIGS